MTNWKKRGKKEVRCQGFMAQELPPGQEFDTVSLGG